MSFPVSAGTVSRTEGGCCPERRCRNHEAFLGLLSQRQIQRSSGLYPGKRQVCGVWMIKRNGRNGEECDRPSAPWLFAALLFHFG